MARAYTVATAAFALKTSAKWVDNALSHHRVAGVVQERQGVARRLTLEALLILALTLVFLRDSGSTLSHAISLAQRLIASGGTITLSHGLKVELDLEAFKDHMLTNLEYAVEVAPLPRRGRPPANRTGRLE